LINRSGASRSARRAVTRHVKKFVEIINLLTVFVLLIHGGAEVGALNWVSGEEYTKKEKLKHDKMEKKSSKERVTKIRNVV
jgi:hypothetical protein